MTGPGFGNFFVLLSVPRFNIESFMTIPPAGNLSGIPKLLALSLLVWISSCSAEIDLILPGDPLPVIYCLLDPADSVQYVRVGSTWSIPAGESFRKPEQEELLMDESAIIYLAAEYSDRKQEIFYAKRIHTIPKDSGWFPSFVNQIYSISCHPVPDTRYSLYAYFPVQDLMVHGETLSLGRSFKVIDPDLVPGREATLINGIDYMVRVSPVVNGSIFQTTMTFRYAEMVGRQTSVRRLVLPQKFVFEDDKTIDYIEQRISGERFLIDISRAIKPDPEVKRIPLGLDFHISCGGDDLALKINAENNTQAFSILDVNSFDNAIGVFSCLTHCFVNDVPLSRFTIDTLALGPLTRNLGFLTNEQIDSLRNESH